MTSEEELTAHAIPWANQFRDDIAVLKEFDAGGELMCELRGNLREGFSTHVDFFCALDLSAIRARCWIRATSAKWLRKKRTKRILAASETVAEHDVIKRASRCYCNLVLYHSLTAAWRCSLRGWSQMSPKEWTSRSRCVSQLNLTFPCNSLLSKLKTSRHQPGCRQR